MFFLSFQLALENIGISQSFFFKWNFEILVGAFFSTLPTLYFILIHNKSTYFWKKKKELEEELDVQFMCAKDMLNRVFLWYLQHRLWLFCIYNKRIFQWKMTLFNYIFYNKACQFGSAYLMFNIFKIYNRNVV